MYSKFGKVLAERFQILKHREEILSGKVKKLKPPLPSTNLKLISIDLIDPATLDHSSADPTDEFQEKSQPDLNTHQKRQQKQSIAFSSQSREEFHKSTDNKPSAPPCGHYNCKYSLVFKSVCVPNLKQRPKTQSKTPQKPKNSKPEKEIKVKILTQKEPFEQQLSRPSITKMVNDVNENRFVKYTDMPDSCSKYKRASTPNIERSTGRKPLFTIRESSPNYTPSFQLVTEDLGKVTSFKNYSARKERTVKTFRDAREYKPKYGLVEKRIRSPDFKKTSSRPTSASPLPSFMKSANWRGAINLMNEKSLEMNHSIDKEDIFV